MGRIGEQASLLVAMTTVDDEYWTRHAVRAQRFRSRRASEHRAFRRELTFDSYGLPLHQGRHAGTYRLHRP